MVSQQQFRLKWNNHRNTVLQEFGNLLSKNFFVDCIVGAEGKYLNAHKIVLSACSPYFQNIFAEHFDKHPVILLKDVLFNELKCLLDYMYNGEVNISECDLPSFLRTAQSLKIKGLAEDISDYDSASDSEQQPAGSVYAENGRTAVEANVEIHDDDGPPAAKKSSTPYLLSTTKSVSDAIAGRKRKSPSSPVPSQGKPNSQARVSVVNSASGAAVARANEFSNSTAVTETETSSLCSAAIREEVASEDGGDSSCRLAVPQSELRQPPKKAEVKEEPVDNEIDNDDNSSYECGNNVCEENDPLNEDSESNCANSGNKFNELSIASVSSFSENDANDDVAAEVKEELLSEVILVPASAGDCCDKLGVRSPSELLSMVDEYTNDDVANGIIVEVKSLAGDEDGCCEAPHQQPQLTISRLGPREPPPPLECETPHQQPQLTISRLGPQEPPPALECATPHQQPQLTISRLGPREPPSLVISDEQGKRHRKSAFLARPAMGQQQPTRGRRGPKKKSAGGQQTLRKILPASLKPLAAMLPHPANGRQPECVAPYHVIKVPPEQLCVDGGADEFGAVVLNDGASAEVAQQPAQNILVLNPSTNRLMLLNSEADSVAAFSVARPEPGKGFGPGVMGVAAAVGDLVVRHPATGNAGVAKMVPVTKFRKIAPQPPSSGR